MHRRSFRNEVNRSESRDGLMLAMLRNMEKEHNTLPADEPFKWPGFRSLAVVLKEAVADGRKVSVFAV